MDHTGSFQEKIRQLGALVGELEAASQEEGGSSARELVQLLMEVHGAGIERLMEIIDESGAPGEAIIERAGRDPMVRHLLLLYSLHPDDLETRVLTALDDAGPRLHKLHSDVELVGIRDGAVQVKVSSRGHVCGSTGKTVQSILEECIYDHAPDLTTLEVIGPEDAPSSGFVALETLTRHLPAEQAAALQNAEA